MYDARDAKWSHEDAGDGWHFPWLFIGAVGAFIVLVLWFIGALLSAFV